MFKPRAIACGILTAALTMTLAQISGAQESTNRVDAKSDWSVFVEEKPDKQCWVVSAPAPNGSTASRGGKKVQVNRGDIRLFVTYWPSKGVKGEISFTGGYPFKKTSDVKMQIGSSAYVLFVDGEFAWAVSVADDGKIATSMRRGASAVLTGISSRGTTTKDTFSLNGFTAAVQEAAKRCG